MPPTGNLYPNSGNRPKKVEKPRAAVRKSLPKQRETAEKVEIPVAAMIPYIPNESAYHHGTFDNTHYFDIIDCIKNKNRFKLNKISPKEVSNDDFKKLVEAYKNYSESAAKAVEGLGKDIDYTYGLQGFAESWLDMEGGAIQYVTPISGSWLETFGILKEIK